MQKDPFQLHNAYNDTHYAKIIKEMKDEIIKKRKILGDDDLKFPEMVELLEK